MRKKSKTMMPSGTKPRIVFFGNERIATGVTTDLPVLNMLLNEGYDIAAIVVSDAGTISRKTRALEVEEFAKIHGITLYKPLHLLDIQESLAGHNASIGILVAYGKMVPESIINLFPLGIINIHPSALPKHRGPTPVESVLLDGSTETAVSLMTLAKAMDAGAIYAQAPVDLTGQERKQELADLLLDIGARSLQAILPLIIAGECHAAPQDHSAATYDRQIAKSDGELLFSKPALQLEREIRAYAEWPKSRTIIGGREVVITAAHVEFNQDLNVDNKTAFVSNKQLYLQTSDGLLAVDRLKPTGKSEMTAQAFIVGYKQFI